MIGAPEKSFCRADSKRSASGRAFTDCGEQSTFASRTFHESKSAGRDSKHAGNRSKQTNSMVESADSSEGGEECAQFDGSFWVYECYWRCEWFWFFHGCGWCEGNGTESEESCRRVFAETNQCAERGKAAR